MSSTRTKDEIEGKSSLTRSYSEDKDAEKAWNPAAKTGSELRNDLMTC